MQDDFLKKIFTSLKQTFFSEKLYSKNIVVFFMVIFLFIIGLFSHSKIRIFPKKVKNSYVKNILIAVSEPFLDFAKKLPCETFFNSARKSVLILLDLENDHHWDDFYYKPKELTIVKTPETSNNSTSESLIPRMAIPEKKKTNDELLVANYEYSKKKPLRILLAGDSQMQSLAEGFKRNIGKHSAFEVTDIAVISSGFVRTDYYNWPAKFKAVFEQAKSDGEPFDVVVLILGMNDFQNFFDGNGNLFRSGTDEWVLAYSEKIKTVMDVLQVNTKKIYWLGLPVVKLPSLNEEVTFVENAQAKAFEHLNYSKVTRFSIRNLVPGKNAPYSDSFQLPEGKKITFMKDDGTHFTIAGASYIMGKILQQLYNDFYIEKPSS